MPESGNPQIPLISIETTPERVPSQDSLPFLVCFKMCSKKRKTNGFSPMGWSETTFKGHNPFSRLLKMCSNEQNMGRKPMGFLLGLLISSPKLSHLHSRQLSIPGRIGLANRRGDLGRGDPPCRTVTHAAWRSSGWIWLSVLTSICFSLREKKINPEVIASPTNQQGKNKTYS